MKPILAPALLALLLAAPAAAQDERPGPSVLFLGNSFTAQNRMPVTLRELARSAGLAMQIEAITPGGRRLDQHAGDPRVEKRLAKLRWSYVVLQEQSTIPAFVGLRERHMVPAARTLAGRIRDAGSEPLLFLTWAYRDPPRDKRDPALGRRFPTYGAMQTEIERSYARVALDPVVNARVAPVGAAFRLAHERRRGLGLWAPDGSHPSPAGSYLAACVFHAAINLRSPVGLDHHGGLEAEVAAFLQQVAHDVVLGSRAWSPDGFGIPELERP